MDIIIHIERFNRCLSYRYKYFRKFMTFIKEEIYKNPHIDNKIKSK